MQNISSIYEIPPNKGSVAHLHTGCCFGQCPGQQGNIKTDCNVQMLWIHAFDLGDLHTESKSNLL